MAVVNVQESAQTCTICDIRKLPAICIVRQGIIIGGRYGGLSRDTEKELIANLERMQHIPIEEHLQHNKRSFLIQSSGNDAAAG